MIENDKEHNSQFIEGCNTDWNLNTEFLHWLNYWFKEYKENASKVVDLEFHEYEYNGKTLTQIEVINRIIELTDKLIDPEYALNDDVEAVEEVFDLFKLVYYQMWW